MGSLRTEFTQTFLNADGTYTLVENTEAIAFKNQKGELELFDNTVIENVHTVNDTEYLYSNTADLCTYGQLCCMSTGYDMVEKLDLRTIWCDACASNYFKPEYLD